MLLEDGVFDLTLTHKAEESVYSGFITGTRGTTLLVQMTCIQEKFKISRKCLMVLRIIA